MTTTTIDLRGLKCPSPLVELNDAITRIQLMIREEADREARDLGLPGIPGLDGLLG